MLKAQIRFSDLSAPVRVSGGSVVFGESACEPFGHRLLRTKLIRSPKFTAIIVYERLIGSDECSEIEEEDGSYANPSEITEAMSSHPLDWMALYLLHENASVEFACAYQSIAPIYMTLRSNTLSVSWDIAEMIFDGPITLRGPNLGRFVTRRWLYSCETFLHGVYRLTPETKIFVDQHAVRYEYPRPAAFVRRHELKQGADPVDLFFDAVCTILALRPLDRNRTALELSGGMDSGITALAASHVLGRPLLSYGAEFEGSMGAAQRKRRELMCGAAGTRDIAIPAEYFASYDADGPRRRPLSVWPEDESYPEIMGPLQKLVRSAGIDTVIAGAGGDEIYPIFVHEAPERLHDDVAQLTNAFSTERCERLAAMPCDARPQGWLLDSCWRTSAARAKSFLNAGLWPVYPFFSKELTAFTFNLPLEWRKDRMLHRRTLTRQLQNSIYEMDYLKESFMSVMLHGFRRNRGFILDLIQNSSLDKLGLIDKRKMLHAFEAGIPEQDLEQNSAFYILNFECFFRGREIGIA